MFFNKKYVLGNNALHHAASGQSIEIAELLIKSGVPLQETNNMGKNKTRNDNDFFVSTVAISALLYGTKVNTRICPGHLVGC